MKSTESSEAPLREAALALHREGKGRREIQRILRVSGWQLNRWLRDAPSLNAARRCNVKDELRERARELRLQGWTYPEIARELNVSKSSVSLWVRDLPAPEPRRVAHVRMMAEARWRREREQRERERRLAKNAAARQVGAITDRELLLIGATLYWAEGGKDKAYARRERVVFTNSDPGVVTVFLRWLDLLGVEASRRAFSVYIHESADVDAAVSFWADLVGVPACSFGKTILKRHNPKTMRKNIGEDHRGCLGIYVRQSADLYRRIEGWWQGVVQGAYGERRCAGGCAGKFPVLA